MNTKTILWGVLVVAVLGFVIWMFNSPVPDYNAGVPMVYNISITPAGYSLETLLVPIGSTIVWTSAATDTRPHTVTSNDGFFTSNDLAPGQKYTYVFNKAGTFYYHDRTAPDHLGRIIVK